MIAPGGTLADLASLTFEDTADTASRVPALV
jgi:hypothetical protein